METAGSLPDSVFLDAGITKSVSDGDVDAVDQFLQESKNFDATDAKKRSLLHYAVAHNRLKVLEKLLAYDVDVNAADYKGWTPLHTACQLDHRDAAKMLIRHDASITSQTSGHGCMPVHVAAQFGSLGAMQELLHVNGDVMCFAADNYTPLHYAAWGGHVDVIRYLLSLDCKHDLLEAKTFTDGYTAVHVASLHGKRDALNELMLRGGSPRIKTKRGIDCYGLSAQGNHTECMKMLSEPCNAGTPRIEARDTATYLPHSLSMPEARSDTHSQQGRETKEIREFDATKLESSLTEANSRLGNVEAGLAEVKDMIADLQLGDKVHPTKSS
ncbi:ankyrin-3-like [Corticium candelabrum]|uniref:ankyrin-3-like n=1 Tax=Corticium candelabrum TaxID=121492 RepID=UPI002E258743|nr:ankyrin-3-like [Corticium candelabrum]